MYHFSKPPVVEKVLKLQNWVCHAKDYRKERERGVPQNEYKLWLPVTAMLACGKERTHFSFFHIISQKQNEVYLVQKRQILVLYKQK